MGLLLGFNSEQHQQPADDDTTDTLPETNIAPKHGRLEYYFPIGKAYVSFREGKILIIKTRPICAAKLKKICLVFGTTEIPRNTKWSFWPIQAAWGQGDRGWNHPPVFNHWFTYIQWDILKVHGKKFTTATLYMVYCGILG